MSGRASVQAKGRDEAPLRGAVEQYGIDDGERETDLDIWEDEGGAILPPKDDTPEVNAGGQEGERHTGGDKMSKDLRIIFGDLFFITDNVVLANGIVPLNEIFLDGAIDPAAREGEPATVSGTINEAQTRMAVERFVRHQSAAERAYEIFASGQGGTAEENWVRAEKELLGLGG